MDEETKELIMQAGGHNPGALRVALNLLQSDNLTGRTALEMAIDADIVREELYLLWNDVHRRDIKATREALCLGQAVGQLQQIVDSKHYQKESSS